MLVKMLIKILCVLIIFLSVVQGNYVFAEATPESGIQIAPIRFNWYVESGEQKNDEIIVHNFADIPHNIEIEVEDFFVSNDSSQANFFVPDENHPLKAYDVINWINVPNNFTLAPGETKKVQFTVNVPKDQPTNGYYGSIFFKTTTDKAIAEDEKGGSLNLDVNYRIGTLITLAVKGEESMHIAGSVEEFNVNNKIFWKSPITIFAKLKSEGNVHYKAGGKIEIKKFGNKFTILKIEDEIMYPDKIRIFTENVMFGAWDYGIYSATLDMQSEDGSVIFKDEIPFFLVIPWKTTVLLLSIVLIIFVIVKIFRKKFAIIDKKKLNSKIKK
jgi:hypothetical protein